MRKLSYDLGRWQTTGLVVLLVVLLLLIARIPLWWIP